MHFKLALCFCSLAVSSCVAGIPANNNGKPFEAYHNPWAASNSGGGPPKVAPSNLSGSIDGGSNPLRFPLSDGFPNIQNPSAQLTAIDQAAHGTLPNGPPPSSAPITDDLLSLRLFAFNELIEVAYFTELLYNLTHDVDGYEIQDQRERQAIIDAITSIRAQEELHVFESNDPLAFFNASPVVPCKYFAPVSDLPSAIDFIRIYTDLVLGTIVHVMTRFAEHRNSYLIPAVGSVVGNKGQQSGFYRNLLGFTPTTNPFPTVLSREFTFSYMNQVLIVPGSCPNLNAIDIPIFGVLNVLTQNIGPRDQQVQFSFSAAGGYSQYTDYKNLSLVFIKSPDICFG